LLGICAENLLYGQFGRPNGGEIVISQAIDGIFYCAQFILKFLEEFPFTDDDEWWNGNSDVQQ
jgi:hypothetical protein